jgi:TRAP-type mannitol/chloroaromatic compound transport system permease large subunit
VAEKLDINLIWFGMLIAMNLQTSFLTPPFGFALFYLRSVAARNDYDDVVTGKRIKAVTTAQIYKGSIAFIVLQVIMVAVILFNPTHGHRQPGQGGGGGRRCCGRHVAQHAGSDNENPIRDEEEPRGGG